MVLTQQSKALMFPRGGCHRGASPCCRWPSPIDRDRDRETERQRQRQSDKTDRETDRETERQRDRETERQREKQRDSVKQNSLFRGTLEPTPVRWKSGHARVRQV